MTISEADVIAAVEAYTFVDVQTAAEASASTHTDANLLYNSGSETQGNFSVFYDDADEKVTSDESTKGINLTDGERKRAIAYLIQDNYEKKFKDWCATDININNDLVKRNGISTSGWTAYTALINEVIKRTSGTIDVSIVRHRDDEYYPDEWREIPESAEVIGAV